MLKADGIQKIYFQGAGELSVLKGVDLQVEKGGIIAIIGPSGAGKSTLLHILGGLDRPTRGRVAFDGDDLYQLSDQERAKIRNLNFGFIFQFYHLLPEFTALENVILPAVVKGAGEMEEIRKKASGILDHVGLGKRGHHRPNELSGGEQQRVAIARALINEPDIIFCDEPTGNLDSATGSAIIDLLMDLNKINGQTLVIVTHDYKIAERSHKVLYMRDGLFVEENEPV